MSETPSQVKTGQPAIDPIITPATLDKEIESVMPAILTEPVVAVSAEVKEYYLKNKRIIPEILLSAKFKPLLNPPKPTKFRNEWSGLWTFFGGVPAHLHM